MPISSEDFASLGRIIMGRDPGGSEVIFARRFVGWFGTLPTVCAIIWADLSISGWLEFAGTRGGKPEHLLWALMFLKCYGTEEVHAAQTCVDEGTFRKWAWFYIEGISRLSRKYVCFYYSLCTFIIGSK
jgi:hypothetical protein